MSRNFPGGRPFFTTTGRVGYQPTSFPTGKRRGTLGGGVFFSLRGGGMTTAIATSLPDLAGKINEAHRLFEESAQSAFDHAITAGRFLVQAKAQVAHGEWLDWVGGHCEFTDRRARHYMLMANNEPLLEQANRNSCSDLPVVGALRAIASARSESKEQKREERRETNREKVSETQSLADLDATFATIVVDPPWDWGDEGDHDQLGRARPTYSTMSIEQVAATPVGKKADIDAHIYLWITNRSLPKGFALLEGWGFRYVTCLTWCKPSIGMGNYFRGSTEQILFGVKGSQPLKRKDVGTWFAAPRGDRQHSTKPAEFYSLVESCSPGPYLDVFSRKKRDGWTPWGADAE